MTITGRAYSFFFAIAFLFAANFAALAGETFTSSLDGSQETPANASAAVGTGTVLLNTAENQITVTVFFSPLSGTQTTAAIHGPAQAGSTGAVIFDLPTGNFTQTFNVTVQQTADLKADLWYFEIRSAAFLAGEIRGQIREATGAAIPFPQSSGVLDSTFGTNGILTTAVGNGNEIAQAVAIQADGKIVVAGYTFNGVDNDFAVVRYNADGTLDNSFNGNGIVTTAVRTSNDEVYGVAIQSDGKIILAGQSFNGTDNDIALVRYNTDGTLDNTFDSDGRVIVAVGVGNDMVRSVAVQSDGRIVAAGSAFNGTNNDIAVVRLNAGGTLDTSFNGSGIVVMPVGTGTDVGYNTAIQTDDKIVVSGYYLNGASTDTVVLRYNANGTLDNTFDGDGIATHSFSPDTDEALAMALQPDGKIVIAGCIRSGITPNDFLHARFNQNGSLDTTFGNNGSITIPFSSTVDIALGVAVQPDGKIVAAGFGSNGTNNDFSVTRLNADGSPDTGFDGDGKLQTAVGTSTDNANAVAVQADGKIVVVGRTVNGATADFGVVRYGYGQNSQGNDAFIGLNATTAIRFDSAYSNGTSFVSILNSAAMPPLPAGWSFIGSPRVIGTSAQFSGNIVVKLTLPAGIDQANFNAVRILQFENGTWNDKTAAAPPRDFAARSVYAQVSSLDPITAASPTGPVTGTSAITGRLLTPTGRSVSNTIVSIRPLTGSRSYSQANPSGYFRFKNLPRGGNFIVTVSSKRYKFIPQLLSLHDDLTEIEFMSR